MNRKVIINICLILVAVFLTFRIYVTPNCVIKAISPKRYVFNCITHTADIMNSEWQNGKKENKDNSDLTSWTLSEDSLSKVLNLKFYCDRENNAISIKELCGNKYIGFSNKNDWIKQYFSFKKLYNLCFDVKRTGRKSISIDNSKNLLDDTCEYTLSFNKEGIKKAGFEKLFVNLNSLSKNKINDTINGVTKNATLRLYIDSKNRVIDSIYEKAKEGSSDITYLELSQKDNKALINDIELFYINKDKNNDLTISLKSKGNHKLKYGSFTDHTTLLITSFYMQVANLNADVFYHESSNFSLNMTGNINNKPIKIHVFPKENSKNKLTASLNIESNYINILSKKYTITNVASKNIIKPKYQNFWNLTEQQINLIKDRTEKTIDNNFVPPVSDEGIEN